MIIISEMFVVDYSVEIEMFVVGYSVEIEEQPPLLKQVLYSPQKIFNFTAFTK